MTLRSDASEVYKLSADLAQVGPRSVTAIRGVMGGIGEAFAREWASNARETSGEHGKHYPDSIDSELVFDITGVSVEVGPNSAKKQGSMGRGFEFGSQNQPPHLDGLRALDGIQARADRVMDSALGHLFG
jgi:hypothetical protein